MKAVIVMALLTCLVRGQSDYDSTHARLINEIVDSHLKTDMPEGQEARYR
jgi:hypothetical protein